MARVEPKTYEELRAERQAEWIATQAIRVKELADLHDRLMQMPDVRDAPMPDVAWSHPDIFCAECATKYFMVTRYVTINGVRYRQEMRCVACGHLDTWDWVTKAWMGG